MATLYSPKIVTGGLVMYLDAANPRSYPRSGTAWNDISGNNITGTLTNGPTFDSTSGGSFVFDGTDKFVQTSINTTLTAMTLMGFIKRNGNQVEYTGIFYSRGTAATGLGFFSTQNDLSYTWNGLSTTFLFDSNLLIPNNQWCMVAVSVTSTAATLYVNTTSVTNSTSHPSTTIDDLKIGKDEFSTRRFNGNIANVMLYNRALSATEVLQNFNATRNRFGV